MTTMMDSSGPQKLPGIFLLKSFFEEE